MSASDNFVRVDLTELRELRARLEEAKGARVKVGILGNKAARFDFETSTSEQDKLNNPTLGLIHEFGTVGPHALPARSFLRVPLFSKLSDEIEKIGRAVWRRIVLKQGLAVALGDLGTIAVGVVQKAFETGGFGQWAPLARSTVSAKGSSAILIDTAQLRKSIAYSVAKGGAS